MTAFGGTAGQNQSTNWGTMLGGYAGTGGSASGGDGNFRGQNGQVNHGGQAPNGGAGGRGGEQTGIYVSRHGPQNATGIYKGEDGATPGGGGGGEASIGSPTPGTNNAGGGAGGYCYRTFLPGQITQGAFYNVTVGGKGHGDMYWGGNGGDGLVRLCWDVPVALPQEYMYWDGNPVMQAWGNGGGSGWGGSNPRDGVDNGGWPFLAWIFQYEPAAAPDPGQGPSCFLAGSPVIMSDGSIKMIEDIQIGEWVKGAYGESNQVLALDRPLLGIRNIYVINNEHRTTDEHPHLKPDNTFYLINKAGWLANENNSWQPVITDTGMTELWNMPGTDDTDILQPFEIGGKVITSTGERTIENITVQQHPADTQLYNLVLGGSHTYFVEGYCVTGFINNKDFDYKSWTANGTPWTADDYRKAKD
jgi:hypothetical protein